jgi:hypothetical protein
MKFHNCGGRRVVLHDQSICNHSSDSRIWLHFEIQDSHSNVAEIKAFWLMTIFGRPYYICSNLSWKYAFSNFSAGNQERY